LAGAVEGFGAVEEFLGVVDVAGGKRGLRLRDEFLKAPRRFVWNPTVRIDGRRRARWACGQAAFEPVHMSTGRLPGARN
jgi:hypothetical protein